MRFDYFYSAFLLIFENLCLSRNVKKTVWLNNFWEFDFVSFDIICNRVTVY